MMLRPYVHTQGVVGKAGLGRELPTGWVEQGLPVREDPVGWTRQAGWQRQDWPDGIRVVG